MLLYGPRQNAWHAVTASLDETDGRSFWLKFKMLTGEAKSSRKQIRLKDENDEATSDSVKVASMFAESLKKIHITHNGPEFCATMKSEVERQVQMCIGEYTPNYMPKAEAGDSDPLADTIDVAEVAGALKLCKSNTAPGQDEITYGILKKVPDCTLSLLADLYTACLTFGYFPKAWKSAIGVMLPKPNKDEKIVTNYRPISLLSTFGVTFSKTMRLAKHCKSKASKAMQRVRLLRMVSGKRWGAKAHTLLKLYKQYIRPVLESGYVATSKACPASLMILQRIQNAALRTALRAKSWSKITALHELAKMEPLTDRLRRLRCKAEARYGQSELIKSLNKQTSLLSGMADKR